jgi:hypothetical protein
MLVNVQGTITALGQKRSGVSASTGNAWAVQEFIIVDATNKTLHFEVFGEEHINKFCINQPINITCSIDSREYNGRYYHNTLRYVAPQAQQNPQQPMQQPAPAPQQAPQQFQQAPQQYAPQQPTYAQPVQAPQPQFNQPVTVPNTDLPF